MRRTVRLSIFFVILFVFLAPAISFSIEDFKDLRPVDDRVFSVYVNGLVDAALKPAVPAARRDALVKRALYRAKVYSILSGNEAVFKDLSVRVISIPSIRVAGEEAILDIRKKSRRMGSAGGPKMAMVKAGTEATVKDLIKKGLESIDTPTGGTEYIETALAPRLGLQHKDGGRDSIQQDKTVHREPARPVHIGRR